MKQTFASALKFASGNVEKLDLEKNKTKTPHRRLAREKPGPGGSARDVTPSRPIAHLAKIDQPRSEHYILT
jgi:hypothetical protein